MGIISFKDKESFDNSIVGDVTSWQEIVQNLIDKTSNNFALNATEYIKSLINDWDDEKNDSCLPTEAANFFNMVV